MNIKMRRLRSYAFWIGLSDRDYASNYYWSDGSPMRFFGWASGNPRDPSGKLKILYLQTCVAKHTSLASVSLMTLANLIHFLCLGFISKTLDRSD